MSPFRALSVGALNDLFRAFSEAEASGSSQLEPVHLLRGILSEPDSVTEAYLDDSGIDPGVHRHRPLDRQSGEVLLSESTKQVLRDARRLAKRLGHKPVHSEHLLAAVVVSGDQASEIRELAVYGGKLEERLRQLPTYAFESCPETRSESTFFYFGGVNVHWPWQRSRFRNSE